MEKKDHLKTQCVSLKLLWELELLFSPQCPNSPTATDWQRVGKGDPQLIKHLSSPPKYLITQLLIIPSSSLGAAQGTMPSLGLLSILLLRH